MRHSQNFGVCEVCLNNTRIYKGNRLVAALWIMAAPGIVDCNSRKQKVPSRRLSDPYKTTLIAYYCFYWSILDHSPEPLGITVTIYSAIPPR
jgi:hypothetical protein